MLKVIIKFVLYYLNKVVIQHLSIIKIAGDSTESDQNFKFFRQFYIYLIWIYVPLFMIKKNIVLFN